MFNNGENINQRKLAEMLNLSVNKINSFNKVKQAVILGAGGKGDFGKPAGFLELEEFRIID
ncbi:MAG: hypothetical protein E6018_15690, partial [Clostridium perfringens]|nr:hypothetical protein [Clostridium perfringens]MDU5660637.1 hypothetical protein [Clostridium perfringens]